uniref:hypothetical protein n=1 Tax=Nocardia suismassiliense TaxID=2077092 RepID=UPI003F4995DC
MRTTWSQTAADCEADERRRARRSWPAPASIPSYAWCADCEHRGYQTKAFAKAALRAHRGLRKGLSVFRCPHDRHVWHIGHRPRDLSHGLLDRHQLATYQRRRRALREQAGIDVDVSTDAALRSRDPKSVRLQVNRRPLVDKNARCPRVGGAGITPPEGATS